MFPTNVSITKYRFCGFLSFVLFESISVMSECNDDSPELLDVGDLQESFWEPSEDEEILDLDDDQEWCSDADQEKEKLSVIAMSSLPPPQPHHIPPPHQSQ